MYRDGKRAGRHALRRKPRMIRRRLAAAAMTAVVLSWTHVSLLVVGV